METQVILWAIKRAIKMLPSRPGVVPLSVHVQWKAVFFLYDRRTQTEGMVRDHGTVRQGPEVRILPRDLCPGQTRLHEGRKVDQVGRKKPRQENELRVHRKRKLRVELRIRRHVPITRDQIAIFTKKWAMLDLGTFFICASENF